MWTDIARRQFARSGLRLASNLKGGDWPVSERLFTLHSHRALAHSYISTRSTFLP
jgi:hypothetical protein